MGSFELGLSANRVAGGLAIAALMTGGEFLHRRRNVFDRIAAWPLPVRFAAYMAIVYLPLLCGRFGEEQQFIYFQF